MKIRKTIFIFLATLPLFFFLGLGEVKADTATVRGRVYVTIDGRGQVPISGVVVFRKEADFLNGKAVISATSSSGEYVFSNNRVEGVSPSVCRRINDSGTQGSYSCPVIKPGQRVSEATCMPSSTDWRNDYHCGLTCYDPKTPQSWLAYFPPDFNPLSLPPGVYFKTGDMKGGGTWQISGSASIGDISIRPGGSNWQLNAENFGAVTYGANEWYQADTSNNAGAVADMNFEWLPSGSYSCTSLDSDAEGEIELGQKLTFTCDSSLANLNLAGYNYRIMKPSDTDWFSPEGWADITGATPEYEISEVGNYQVQCQVCVEFQGDQVCTDWGKAN